MYRTVNISLLGPLYKLVQIIQIRSIIPLETATVVLLHMPFAIPDVEKAKHWRKSVTYLSHALTRMSQVSHKTTSSI